jgi:hypothetical protein
MATLNNQSPSLHFNTSGNYLIMLSYYLTLLDAAGLECLADSLSPQAIDYRPKRLSYLRSTINIWTVPTKLEEVL